MAQRVGRGIALLFHDRGTRKGWVVSSTPRPHITPGKHTVPILQEAGWAPGSVWTGGKFRPHRDSIPDRPARSQVTISFYPHSTSWYAKCRFISSSAVESIYAFLISPMHTVCSESITVRFLMPVACLFGTVTWQQVGRLIDRGSIRGSHIFSSSNTSRPVVWPKQPLHAPFGG